MVQLLDQRPAEPAVAPTPNPVGTGYAPSPTRLNTGPAPGAPVDNTRGLTDRSLPFSEVIKGYEDKLTPEQKRKLAVIYATAQDTPDPNDPSGTRDRRSGGIRNRGQDLRDLMPLLVENPGLIDNLYRLSTTDSLFGEKLATNATKAEREDFERRRADYLIDVLAAGADPSRLTQGPGAMCTSASMLKHLPRAEFLRLATGYAVDGRVTTASGKVMVARPEFRGRSVTNSGGTLDTIRCIRPSAGMLNLLDGVQSLGVPDVTVQSGAYWWQYTDAWRHLTGREAACAAPDGDVFVGRSGVPVQNQADSVETVKAYDLMMRNLRSGRPGVSYLIDTEWSHAGAYQGAERDHCRHMLVAKGTVMRNGEEYVVCDNPIGAFIDPKTGTYYPEGTVLGNKDGFWFVTGPGGTVYVRTDVLRTHLRTITIEYGDRFDAANPTAARSIGDIATTPINFLDAEDWTPTVIERQIQPKVEVATERPELTPEDAPMMNMAKESADRQLAHRRGPRNRKEEDVFWDPSDIDNGVDPLDPAFVRFASALPKNAPDADHLRRLQQGRTEVPDRPLPTPTNFKIAPPTTPPQGSESTISAFRWGADPFGSYTPKK